MLRAAAFIVKVAHQHFIDADGPFVRDKHDPDAYVYRLGLLREREKLSPVLL
jgi:hypothetical protein